MTSINTDLANKPFLLKPAGKDYLWGGQLLNDEFGKNIPMNPLAETWECSTHPDGPSIVASGIDQGKTLAEILVMRPELLGTHPRKLVPDGLPVLVKLIDAKEDLSVQVHPTDKYAEEYEHGQLGKSEFWYVIDAQPGAKLVYGFRSDVTRDQVERSVCENTIEQYLQYVPVHRGDVFFIPAGTVHSIGGGILLAEIQESSNLTYRLYDYNRLDHNGKKRDLHIQKALEVVNLKKASEPRQPFRKYVYKPGYASELLCRCKYFEVERICINTESVRKLVEIQKDSDSFEVWLCLNGGGNLFGDDVLLNIFKGDCIFIPANSEKLRMHGKGEFLKIRC